VTDASSPGRADEHGVGEAPPPRPDAVAVLRGLEARGWSIAAAESLTGGRVTAALVDVPGASAHVRGGIVAARGPVDPDVAVQMAQGVRGALRADVGLATTGVAGPDPQDDKPVGTVHIAVATPETVVVSSLALSGSRDQIRTQTVQRVLELALTVL
jgi:nicotinamide-nucleotide amidase